MECNFWVCYGKANKGGRKADSKTSLLEDLGSAEVEAHGDQSAARLDSVLAAPVPREWLL